MLFELFETYKIQFIETLIALTVFFALRLIIKYFIKLRILNLYIKISERKDILKLINLLLAFVFCIIIVAIWGVKQENILIVAGSILSVLGVAMFAEMSILSNITACLILFFQHPIKSGDMISINHEGNEIEGEIIDISYFFVFIKTANRGIHTVPNALLLKTSFMILEDKKGASKKGEA